MPLSTIVGDARLKQYTKFGPDKRPFLREKIGWKNFIFFEFPVLAEPILENYERHVATLSPTPSATTSIPPLPQDPEGSAAN